MLRRLLIESLSRAIRGTAEALVMLHAAEEARNAADPGSDAGQDLDMAWAEKKVCRNNLLTATNPGKVKATEKKPSININGGKYTKSAKMPLPSKCNRGDNFMIFCDKFVEYIEHGQIEDDRLAFVFLSCFSYMTSVVPSSGRLS